MTQVSTLNEKTKNHESAFSELFALLRRYESLPNGFCTLSYETNELIEIQGHVDNSINVLLQGLQDIGQLMNVATQHESEVIKDLNNIGGFISAIGNLTEALNDLRLDSNYVLKQRGDL